MDEIHSSASIFAPRSVRGHPKGNIPLCGFILSKLQKRTRQPVSLSSSEPLSKPAFARPIQCSGFPIVSSYSITLAREEEE